MPYKNYHSARLRDPDSFSWIKVFKITKEGIIFRGGPLKSDPRGSTEIQAIWFPVKRFTVSQCKSWLKEHKFKYILFEPATG